MSEIQAITLPKHVNLKAVIEDGQGTITFISKRGNEHPCLHIMELAEGREFLTQCLVALNVANSPEPQPKKENVAKDDWSQQDIKRFLDTTSEDIINANDKEYLEERIADGVNVKDVAARARAALKAGVRQHFLEQRNQLGKPAEQQLRSVQVKLVGTLPKDTQEPVDEFKRMLQETGIQAGDTILMDGKPHTITSIRPSQMPNRVHVTLGWATEVLPTWESLVEMKKLEERGGQDWDTAVLRNCQHSWHIDDARDTPTCPGCDAEA